MNASPWPISSIISNRQTEELDDVSGQALPAAPCVVLAVGTFEGVHRDGQAGTAGRYGCGAVHLCS